MAEQEACADLVDKAGRDQAVTSGGTIDGESQLLPLLQGLLEAPDAEQTADSGTESGEDQRIGLISEVQSALDKLSASLKSDSTDVTDDRRRSLLQLVTKLQVGLAASAPSMERRSSSSTGAAARFTSRRRARTNRHTVGVSSEELADARRLIEEISLRDLTPSTSCSSANTSNGKMAASLKKQNSEGSVPQRPFKPFSPQKVKNAVAKPFSSSNSTVSGNSSSVHTPTDSLDFLFNEDNTTRRSISLEDSPKSPIRSVMAVEIRKTPIPTESSETDEDSTVKAQPNPPDLVLMQTNPVYKADDYLVEEKLNRFNAKKLKMKRANTIDIPKPLNFYEDDTDEEDFCNTQRRRSNYLALRGPIRLGNSDMNANPKIMPVLQPKTENDKKFLAFINKHQDGDGDNKRIDRKSSLWSKPSDNNTGAVWSNKFGNIKTAFEKAAVTSRPCDNGGFNTRAPSLNSARQFWKTCDDGNVVKPSNFGPKISRESAKNLQQMFEEKKRTGNNQNLPWSSIATGDNVVTGSLKLKTNDDRNRDVKPVKFVPQPLPVNKFSHAPQSAFKPLPPKTVESALKKTVIRDKEHMDQPLFLYSPPKPAPDLCKPWLGDGNQPKSPVIGGGGCSRVRSLAHSKFENAPQPQVQKPGKSARRPSREKVTVPPILNQNQPVEKLTAPYLVKSVENGGGKNGSSVRKLSGQYDNFGNNDSYSTFTTVKYAPAPPSPGVSQHFTGLVQYNNNPVNNNRNQYYQNQYQENQQQRQVYGQPRQPNQYRQANNAFSPPIQLSTPSPQLSPLPSQQNNEYTSTCQFRPNLQQKSPQMVPRIEETAPPKLESQISTESVHECSAVSSQVMRGPVSQQAETVRQKSPMSRNDHDMAAALGLKSALQKVGNKPVIAPVANDVGKVVIYNNVTGRKPETVGDFKPISPKIGTNGNSRSPGLSQSFTYSNNNHNRSPDARSPAGFKYQQQIDEEGVVSSKFQIPLIKTPKGDSTPLADKVANKADTWNQICLQQQLPHHKPSPRSSPNARTVVKSKSSHSLAIPMKQFEAGMSRDEVATKKRTMEAFFSPGGAKSPQSLSRASSNDNVPAVLVPKPLEIGSGKVVKRSINRIKTSEKVSATYRHQQQGSIGLSRSRTLPDIVCPQLLDESNVDAAFEDLFKSST